MADDIILETRGLTKEFKGFVAVSDVNLRVRQGHIHALIGPNGAGKTTCFNLLTHFLTPTRGQIFYKGREITGSSPAKIARMGLARSFQISAVFPHLTVLENVRIALQRKRGKSFDFWRTDRVLGELNSRAASESLLSVLGRVPDGGPIRRLTPQSGASADQPTRVSAPANGDQPEPRLASRMAAPTATASGTCVRPAADRNPGAAGVRWCRVAPA